MKMVAGLSYDNKQFYDLSFQHLKMTPSSLPPNDVIKKETRYHVKL